MKKILLATLFYILLIPGLAADKLSSVVIENFGYQEKISYLYDTFGHRVFQLNEEDTDGSYVNTQSIEWMYIDDLCFTETTKKWESGQFVDFRKVDYKYNNNILTEKTIQDWAENKWINSQQEQYITSNNKSYTIQRYWLENNWVDKIKTEYVYEDLKLVEIYFYLKNNAQWVNDRYIRISYNEQQLKSEEVIFLWDTDALKWIESEKMKYTYTNTNLPQLEERQEWNATDKDWEKKYRFSYEYDAFGNTLSQVNARWNVCFWENDTRVDSKYDTQYNLISKEIFSWIYNMWLSAYYEQFSFDTSNNQTQAESYVSYWGISSTANDYYPKHLVVLPAGEKPEIYYGYKIKSIYKPLSEIIKNSDEASLIVFPNPSPDGIFYVNAPNLKIKDWRVVSIDGKLIKQSNGGNNSVINLQGNATGVYVLKIHTDQKFYVVKLIKK